MISDTKFLSQLKLVKGAIKTPKSFAHKYFIFVFNFNTYLLKRTFHPLICINLRFKKKFLSFYKLQILGCFMDNQ